MLRRGYDRGLVIAKFDVVVRFFLLLNETQAKEVEKGRKVLSD